MTEIKYQSTILSVAIHRPANSPIYGDFVTKIRVDDEGGGPFIALSQSEYRGRPEGEIWLDSEELELIVNEARRMLLQPAFTEAVSDEN